ncbi:hypothetical protein [Rhizobium sp. Leaf262]|uniref:hypothetical protein n=1 Tax=Rhizobium sp. Leaf262 TaxID=1736312 RepID=UPI0007151462|nr:hypothetical protein [Rhizobium sp. Leaf262]KQO76088.1 hypothetical protein ASF29_08775 [Rhizobium sp. Leaf262]
MSEVKTRIEATIAELYDADTAKWFMEAQGNDLLDDNRFDAGEGFNVLVFVEAAKMSRSNRPR